MERLLQSLDGTTKEVPLSTFGYKMDWSTLCCGLGALHGIHQRQEESHLRKNGHIYCDQLTLASDFLPVSPFPMNRGAVGLEDSSYLTGRRTSVHAKLYHQEQRKDGCSILDVCFNTINQEERAAKVICVCLWKFQ